MNSEQQAAKKAKTQVIILAEICYILLLLEVMKGKKPVVIC